MGRCLNCFVIAMVLGLVLVSTGTAMTWHQGSYNDSDWSTGYAPLGFNDTVTTETPAGHSTYYFRNLFYLPSTSDPAMAALRELSYLDSTDEREMTELRITVTTSAGVIVMFHSQEAGRSAWLPPGDLPYDFTAEPTTSVETQTFDLTDILFACDNGIGSNYRSVTVEVHQPENADSLWFDAMLEAKISGSWEPVIEDGSRWSYWPEPSAPPATREPVIDTIYHPLAGLPELLSPGDHFQTIVDNTLSIDDSIFLVSSPESTRLISDPATGAPDEKGQTILLNLPEDIAPGTYTLQIVSSNPFPLPGEPLQNVYEARAAVGVLPAEDTEITLIHISDSHVPYRGSYNPDNTAELQQIWDELPDLLPDVVIHTGDGYNEGNFRDQAEQFRNMLDSCSVPVVYVSGNHELGEWCGDGSSREHYWDFFGWPRLDPRRDDHLTSKYRDFIVDVGDLSLVGIETWVSYTDYWRQWYISSSISYAQAQWMVSAAADRPDQTLVACYHHDFDGTLESQLLADRYQYGLSGHTHRDDEYTFGPVTTCLKVAATYGSSQPMRRLQFSNGELVGNELLRSNPVDIMVDPPMDQFAKRRTVTIRNKHNGPLKGHKAKIPMIPGLDYTVLGTADTRKLGQWDGNDRTWVWLSNDLETFEQREIDILPAATEQPDCHVVFDVVSPVFRAGEHNSIGASLINYGQSNMVQPYIAMEVSGLFFFWPDWSETPSVQRMFLNRDQVMPVEVLSLTWPTELALYGETVTFWGVIIDDGSGELISPITQTEMIY